MCLKVFTSNIKGAGTDSNVDVNIIGERGETGFNRLVANYDTFERGQVNGIFACDAAHLC